MYIYMNKGRMGGGGGVCGPHGGVECCVVCQAGGKEGLNVGGLCIWQLGFGYFGYFSKRRFGIGYGYFLEKYSGLGSSRAVPVFG